MTLNDKNHSPFSHFILVTLLSYGKAIKIKAFKLLAKKIKIKKIKRETSTLWIKPLQVTNQMKAKDSYVTVHYVYYAAKTTLKT